MGGRACLVSVQRITAYGIDNGKGLKGRQWFEELVLVLDMSTCRALGYHL